MRVEILKFIQKYATDEQKSNSLIVSSFISCNNIVVKRNSFLKSFIIDDKSDERGQLEKFKALLSDSKINFDFEVLIELFEFIISPKDKKVNGAVYTPKFIRDYINQEVIKSFKGKLSEVTACDFSVGCGGFLFTLAKILRQKTKRSYCEIFKRNIFGLDITRYSVERSKILLSLLAVSEGEDIPRFDFNLEIGNALSFRWKTRNKTIKANDGFDIILGNPPYVCSRNINNESFNLLSRWSVCGTGHPDLYIPFFQIGLENLSSKGVLGFITVNTFLKSINGRALRNYFAQKSPKLRIINFGGEQIFKDRNTYTCLCFIEKQKGNVEYKITKSESLGTLKQSSLLKYSYDNLNHNEGWNLVNSKALLKMIIKVERTGIKFKDNHITRNGIATLKNEVYIFVPFKSTKKYYYLKFKNQEFAIEKSICKDIINSNTIKSTADLRANDEKIIFPFTKNLDEEIELISDADFRTQYPYAYSYLESQKTILGKRDKGKAKNKYPAWYDYGRRQSLDIDAYKLFFPHICERPTFYLSRNKSLLFYNGIAVISNDLKKLQILKKILESDIFFNYIRHTTKNYSSGYISLSKNYIKNFGIPTLSKAQQRTLLNLKRKSSINDFISSFY